MSGLTGNNILAGSSGQGGYEIEQSLRFEDGDSPYLSKTFASSSNRKTWTLSFWTKRGNISLGSNVGIMECGDQIGTNETEIIFGNGDNFYIYSKTSNAETINVQTNQLFRDVGAWYHIVLVVDTTSATSTITGSSTDRVRIYVNGSQVTNLNVLIVPALNSDHWINSNTYAHNINKFRTNYYDGYLAEYNFIDGQALDPSNFGETDLLTNQWIPKKYVGTYGTNGFYLDFGNSASLGADSSGNGNNFTPTNLAATDQVLDSPTNNFCTINPIDRGSTLNGTFSEGNTRVVINNDLAVRGTIMYPKTGKWYAECLYKDDDKTTEWGFSDLNDSTKGFRIYTSGTISQLKIRKDNVDVATPSYPGVNTIYSIAYDADTGDVEAFVNGSSVYSGTLSTVGLDYIPRFVHGSSDPSFYSDIVVNYGQDSSFAGNKTAQNNTDGNGKGDFYYAPPSGYLALCEDNLPDPSIALPGDHFNTVLYTGNGTSQSITGVGFQPDLSWFKVRSTTYDHQLHDAVRGAGNAIYSNLTNAEGAISTVSSFDSDGFTVDASSYIGTNASGQTFAAWNWKANTSGSSNTDGTITSTVSANPTAGFSIVSYTGNGTDGATVGHGLSEKPDFIIIKKRQNNTGTNTGNWICQHSGLSSSPIANSSTFTLTSYPNGTIYLNVTNGQSSYGFDNQVNANTDTYIAYCFHSVEGYSKFGSYTANGSADGPFIYTGFRPAFLIIKRTDGATDWILQDNKRLGYNVDNNDLIPNQTYAEATDDRLDQLSSGFKLRSTFGTSNASGGTYIYMAFAESPLKTSNAR